MTCALLAGTLLLLGLPNGSRADTVTDQQPPLSVRADPAAGYHAVLHIGSLLDDKELEEAARSGLPLRMRIRVELWKDGFIDDLAASQSWSLVLLYEPLEKDFIVGRRSQTAGARRYPTYEAARAAIRGDYSLPIQPTREGNYYYTASLEVETLSLSDLEELERWLQGQLSPAVSGERSLPGALGQGVKRLMMRLLRLPTRHVEARSPRFTVPPTTKK